MQQYVESTDAASQIFVNCHPLHLETNLMLMSILQEERQCNNKMYPCGPMISDETEPRHIHQIIIALE